MHFPTLLAPPLQTADIGVKGVVLDSMDTAQLRQIIDTMARPVALLNPYGYFFYVNAACEALFAVKANELLNRSLANFLNEGDAKQFGQMLCQGIIKKRKWKDDSFGQRPDGSIFPLSIIYTPIFFENASKSCVLIELEDPSNFSVTMSRLLQTERLAALGEMVSSLSHELNNPLAIICGYSELLSEISEDNFNATDAATYAATITKQAERCRVIINKLMCFSRVHEASPSLIQLNEILHNGMDLISNELRKHCIEVKFDLDDQLPHTLGDGHKLLQAFIAIFLNAIEAMSSKNRGCITVVTQCATGPALIIDIQDDGPGVASELKQKIFQPFFTTKEGCSGSGLGLALAYGIIKEHGGWIAEIGQVDSGGRFRIQIPLRIPKVLKRTDAS